MPGIRWIVCPHCTKKFYIHFELVGRGLNLFCPWCKKYFPEREGKEVKFAGLPTVPK